MGSTTWQAVQQKSAAQEFVERWQSMSCNEEEHSRSFWIEFAELLGIKNPTHFLEFERKIKGRKMDVFYEDMGILIEQKGRGISLDEASVRSKQAGAETPFEQAMWYRNSLPDPIAPRWIITCNFDEFRIYDLNDNDGTYVQVFLEELPEKLHLFSFFTDKSNSRIVQEQELSVKAGEIVGRLYKAFAEQYQNIENDEHEQHSLNVLIVRIVFLLYAEDAGVLQGRLAFYEYMRDVPEQYMRQTLLQLFEVLDTPEDERDPYLNPGLQAFPYVNGGLFSATDIVVPQFTPEMRKTLLREASAAFDWSEISPTIFGALFESTLNPETRRSGGMHYTSVENIHKVIDPLFLDDLKKELQRIEALKTEYDRKIQLQNFQKNLSQIKILDPACGSGNFLTESYLALRKLENRVIEQLEYGQSQMGFDTVEGPIMVTPDQFYGIEINDFAVSVAKTAMDIAESQMMKETMDIVSQSISLLPLKKNTTIHCANALCTDWKEVFPASERSYIIGNPPFVGATLCNKQQKTEIVELYGKKTKRSSSLDYVSGWYYKASEFMSENTNVRTALVSTNSITFGEQVYPIWRTLFDRFQMQINFAWKTFVWNNEASDKAHVHVVVIGFSASSESAKRKLIFERDGSWATATNINPYLIDAPNVLIESRGRPINNAPRVSLGCKPTDGGNYIFTASEKEDFLAKEPRAAKWFHPFLGSYELINSKKRYCLYLGDVDPSEIYDMPLVQERMKAVREMRLASTAVPTKKAAETPQHFFFEAIPSQPYIAIPEVSSERRRYIPIDILDPTIMASNQLWIMPEAGLYEFGLLMSQFHNAWMRVVCGRLESRYRYSGGVVYNNFPWPQVTKENIDTPVEEVVPADIREEVEGCAQAVLDARALFPDASLADLYDPDKMPANLLGAHQELDAAVEKAYGVSFHGDEEKIVAHLFELYANLTDSEK